MMVAAGNGVWLLWLKSLLMQVHVRRGAGLRKGYGRKGCRAFQL
jgi:hypothetical protein